MNSRIYSTLLAVLYAFGILQIPLVNAQEQKVLYYGFFFDEITANSIQNITTTYLESCIENIPEFKLFLTSVSNATNVSNIENFYSKPLDPNTSKFDPYYHVTAKFCGGDIDCSAYANSSASSLGKQFEMHIIGYYFTNRTFGIRVQLTPEQETVFDNSKMDLQGTKDASTKKMQTLLQTINLPGITFVDQELNFNPTNNKAHITIGCAPGISAEITGTDLLEIINYEHTFNSTNFANYSLPNSNDIVVQYGQLWDAFVIYPAQKILANATFQEYLNAPSTGSSIRNNYIHIIILLTSIASLLVSKSCIL